MKGCSHLPEAGEEVEEGFPLVPHLGEGNAEDDGKADQTQDVGAVRPLAYTQDMIGMVDLKHDLEQS